MLTTPQVWCVGGYPGCGKTTLVSGLVATGGFAGFERDVVMGKLEDTVGIRGFRDLLEARRNVDFPRVMSDYMTALEGALDRIISYDRYYDSDELHEFVRFCMDIRAMPRMIRFNQFITNPQIAVDFLNQISGLLARYDTLQQGITEARKREKIALVVNNALTDLDVRDAYKKFLQGHGVDTRLLIVRATRKQLLDVSQKRMKDAKNPHPQRHDLDVFIPGSAPYSSRENWQSVTFVTTTGPIETTVFDVRDRLLAPSQYIVTEPVDFLAG